MALSVGLAVLVLVELVVMAASVSLAVVDSAAELFAILLVLLLGFVGLEVLVWLLVVKALVVVLAVMVFVPPSGLLVCWAVWVLVEVLGW